MADKKNYDFSAFTKPSKEYDFSSFEKKKEDSNFNDPLQTLTDTARGAAQGATLGFADELTGGLEAGADLLSGKTQLQNIVDTYNKHRDESRVNYKAAEDRSPTASTLGNVLGGVGASILTAGASAPLAEAGLLTRIANAAKVGAGAGAVGGIGTSEADLTKGEVGKLAQDTLLGAGTGALMGGVLQGGVEATKNLGKVLKGTTNAVGKTKLAQDSGQSFKLGTEGENIVTSEGLNKAEQSVRSSTKDVAFGAKDALKNAGIRIGEAEKLAEEKGINVNAKDASDKLKQFIIKAQNSPDSRDRADAKVFQELLDNMELGVEKEIPIQSSKISPAKMIKEKPSSEDKLLNQVAKEVESERLVNPDAPLDRELVTNTDENGKDLISLLRSATNKETGEAVPVSAKTILDTPGVEAGFIPPERGALVTNMEKVRSGGSDLSNLSMEQANKFKEILNTQNGVIGSPDLRTTTAVNLGKQVAGDIDKGIRKFEPLALANDQYSAASQAFKTFGIDPKTAFIKDAVTKESRLTIEAQQQLNNTIKRMARDTDAGENASVKLLEGLRLLEGADPNIANQLRPQVEKASQTLDLAQKAQRLGLLNKSTYLKSGSIYGANVAGLAVKKITDATPQEIKNIAQNLMSKGANGMKAASVISDALKKDNVGRNAALFAMQQDPNYRQMLKEYFTEEKDKK